MMPQMETITKIVIMPQNIIFKLSWAVSLSMLQRYLMSPQKKTTMASVMKRPITPFKNVLMRTSVSRSVAALASAGRSSAAKGKPETAIGERLKRAYKT